MAEQDKPLHVRVAEALGWTECDHSARSEPWEFHDEEPRIRVGLGIPPGESERQELPRYDTDWSATGPLIERYQIELEWKGKPPEWIASYGWQVGRLPPHVLEGRGLTPLFAVCQLILALHAAGKLDAAAS